MNKALIGILTAVGVVGVLISRCDVRAAFLTPSEPRELQILRVVSTYYPDDADACAFISVTLERRPKSMTLGEWRNLVLKVTAWESGFNRYAWGRNRNGTEDRGFMQVNSGNAKRIAKRAGVYLGDPEEVYAPRLNYILGCEELRRLVDRHGIEQALRRYNAGSKHHTKVGAAYYNKVMEQDIVDAGELE
jgi:hypothetical protein